MLFSYNTLSKRASWLYTLTNAVTDKIVYIFPSLLVLVEYQKSYQLIKTLFIASQLVLLTF